MLKWSVPLCWLFHNIDDSFYPVFIWGGKVLKDFVRCSLRHGKPESCSQCREFPCEKYEDIDAFDSFFTHQNQKRDLKKQQKIGRGHIRRKKNFFCVAVNLLELEDLRSRELCSLSIKERAAYSEVVDGRFVYGVENSK